MIQPLSSGNDPPVADGGAGRVGTWQIGCRMVRRSRSTDDRRTALTGLGLTYRDGRGVPQDNEQALAWLRKAADRRDAGGMSSLGHLYEEGLGVPQDRAEAVKWYRKAAARGDAFAAERLKELGEQ